jgi:signal transduction histidine kinase
VAPAASRLRGTGRRQRRRRPTRTTPRRGDRGEETEVAIQVPDDLELSHEAEALLFRAAQEALRNVAEHAEAGHAVVTVGRRNGHAVLVVNDDGRGFTHEQLEARQAAGHVGLRLLVDLAETAGGAVELHSTPGRGTCLRIEVPAA